MNPPRTVDEARMLDHLVLAGWGTEFRAKPAAAYDAASLALDGWIDRGLPFDRRDDGSRAFDPAEVVNFAKSEGMAGRDDFWATRYVATGRKLAGEFGARPQSLGPRRISVRLERCFNLQHHPPGSRVRLRAPFPANGHGIYELKTEAQPPATRVQPGYVETFVTVPEQRTTVVSVSYEFLTKITSNVENVPLDARDTELYLQPLEGLIRTTPRVSALAKELAGNAFKSLDVLRAFWGFFLERMRLGVLHEERLPPHAPLDAILDLGWFDCRVGSALLVALCRARGIPARTCSGFTLYSVPFYHYWAEAWIEDRGWFPLDLSCCDLSLRGTDAAWREYFFGTLDYRLIVEVLPHTFTGFPSIDFPGAWYALARPLASGAAFGIFSAETSDLVYEDRVAVNVNAGPLLP